MRLVSLVAVLSLVSGCGSNGKMVAGGITTTAGAVLIAHRADARCSPPSELCDALIAEPTNMMANAFTTGLGIGLVALGATMFIMGATDDKPEAPPAPVLSPTLPEPPPVALDRDKLEDRLAMQASRTARTGNCAAAVTTADQLAARDHDLYMQLLTHDDNLATCYALERASSSEVGRGL